jgi:quercetin dioxygenase-like cupin family protein
VESQLPEIEHFLAGGVYVKQTRIPAGTVLVQHKHLHDHFSYLVSGSVELELNGVRRRLDAPQALEVVAGEYHGVKALTDAVWLCIHATSCADIDDVDAELVAPTSDGPEMQAIAGALL